MSFLKTLSLATLALCVALALNADPAMAKPKHKGNKHHNKHLKDQNKHLKNHTKKHHQQDYDDDHHAKGYGKKHGHGKYNCDLPYGLRKQGKFPPGWAKKCGQRPHAHDRSNQDPGYHEPDRDRGHHAGNSSPCTKVSGKAKDIAVGTAMGSVLGGVIGSGTGDTETGAVFGGVVGGIIGATAGDGDKSKSSLPKC